MKINLNRKLNIVIGTIIIIIIVFLFFLVGNYCHEKKRPIAPPVPPEIEDNLEEDISLSLADNEVVKLKRFLKSINLDCGLTVDEMFHSSKKTLLKNLDIQYKLRLVASSFDTTKLTKNENGNFTISEKLVEDYYHELFGKDAHYSFYEDDYCRFFRRVNEEEVELVDTCSMKCGAYDYTLMEKLIKAEKQDDTLSLYYSIVYFEGDQDNLIVKYFSDPEFFHQMGYVELEIDEKLSSGDIRFKENIDDLTEYRYIFKLEDEHYIFYGVERVEKDK